MMVAAVTMRMKRDSLINNIDSKLISNKLTFTTSNEKKWIDRWRAKNGFVGTFQLINLLFAPLRQNNRVINVNLIFIRSNWTSHRPTYHQWHNKFDCHLCQTTVNCNQYLIEYCGQSVSHLGANDFSFSHLRIRKKYSFVTQYLTIYNILYDSM